MAWNGSADKGEATSRRLNKKNSPLNKRQDAASPIKKGLLAGTVVVIGGGLAAWLFMGGEEGERDERGETRSSRIAEVKPQIATNKVAEQEAPKRKPVTEMTDEEKLADIRAKYGNNIPENLKRTVYFLENPPKREFKAPERPSHVFKRRSEREIAEFLMVEPGTWMLLKPQFNDSFDQDFAASLNEAITFDKDDSDFQRELKQAVIDSKAEIAARVSKGEKASEIMNEMSTELYELGRYRQDIEKMVRDVRLNPAMTDADVEDCVKAANEMLEAKGAKPLTMPNMMFRQAVLKIQAEKKEKETQK